MGAIDTYPPQNVSAQTPVLGYAQITSPQTGIGSTTTAITGLSVTVTVPAGRRIRISTSLQIQATAATARVLASIFESGAELQRIADYYVSQASSWNTKTGSVVLSPTAGTHTYYLTAACLTTGTISIDQSSGVPGYILVEDISGSQLPVLPQSVPVGTLGQTSGGGAVTINSTTYVDLGVSLNVTVPAGRTLLVTGKARFSGGVSADVYGLQIRQDGVSIGYISNTLYTGAGWGTSYLPVITTVSPSAGAHTYTMAMQRETGTGTATSQGVDLLLVEDISPTPAPGQGAPGSTLGYAEVTANQAAITTEVDLTGLSVTVTVPAGRRLKIIGNAYLQNTGAGNAHVLVLQQDGIEVNEAGLNEGAANSSERLHVMAVVSPSAGSHTYKLRAKAIAGTTTMVAAATLPAFILVEDITGAVWPVGSTVTAGMVASEAWTPFTPTVRFGGPAGTIASITSDCSYKQIGRLVTASYAIRYTNLNGGSGYMDVSLPVPGRATTNPASFYFLSIGVGSLVDISTGNAYFHFVTYNLSSSLVFRSPAAPMVTMTNTAPVTIAAGGAGTGDEFYATVTYEAAS